MNCCTIKDLENDMACQYCRFEYCKIIEASLKLHKKIKQIIESPSFAGIFNIAQIHGMEYNGLSFDSEFYELDEAIKKLNE